MSKASSRSENPAANPATAAEALPDSYEAAMDELNQWVAALESGDLPLDQLLAGYQRGAQLLQFCREKLQAVEEQIKVLDDGLVKAWKQP